MASPEPETLRGINAPEILGLVATLRAKKHKNSSSARHYGQISFRFHTAWSLGGLAGAFFLAGRLSPPSPVSPQRAAAFSSRPSISRAQPESGTALKAQAVLFRASHHSAALEIELAVRGIPFVKFGGLKFLDSAHVKDVLACLRWAENPRDRVAGFRVLQLLPGIGPAKAGQILDQTGSAGAVVALAELRAPSGDRAEWSAFADMARRLSLRLAGWPAEIKAIRRWYEPHLERIHDDAPARKADLMQLEQIAAGYQPGTLPHGTHARPARCGERRGR
jgi:hypothetical protein